MRKQTKQIFEFNQFRLDVERGRLLRAGEIIPLPPKAISLLLVLLKHQGRVVEKETILQTIWPDTVVEDSNLTQTVHLLRKALGKNGASQPQVETIPKIGYRMVAEVRELWGQDDDPAPNLPAPVHEAGAAAAIPASRESTELADEGNARLIPPEHEAMEEAVKRVEPGQVAGEKRSSGVDPGVKTRSGFGSFVLALLQSRAMRISAVAIAGVLLGMSPWAPRREAGLIADSVAVLPFSSLNANSNDLSLSLGIADALITKLSSVGVIEVRPTAAILRYDGSDEKTFDPLKAGRELGVGAVVTGHVQVLNGRLRVTVQLLRVANGQTLWAGKFEESLTHLFELEDTIADQVTDALALPKNNDARQALRQNHTKTE